MSRYYLQTFYRHLIRRRGRGVGYGSLEEAIDAAKNLVGETTPDDEIHVIQSYGYVSLKNKVPVWTEHVKSPT